MNVELNTKLTNNLCLEGLKAEIARYIAMAKKEVEINNSNNIEVYFHINITFKDLCDYTESENKRICQKKK